MSLDGTIRENLDGKYLTIYADHFKKGIDYAAQVKINQIQIIGVSEIENIVDFKELEKMSEYLQVISFAGDGIENVVNLESIYSLENIHKIYFQQKQKFAINISRFPKLQHLGGTYWKGLQNIDKAFSLTSTVLLKLTDINLKRLSALTKLRILHIYSSKIQTLDGIETLQIEELSLARNNFLEDVHTIKDLTALKRLEIEKCKKITDYDLIESLKNRVKVNIIK